MCSLVGGIQFKLNNTFNYNISALIYKMVCVTSRPRYFPVKSVRARQMSWWKLLRRGAVYEMCDKRIVFRFISFKVVVCWGQWTFEIDYNGALAVFKNDIGLGYDFKKR